MKSILNKALACALKKERFDLTEDGLLFRQQGVMVTGEYFDRINGGEWMRTKNIIVAEGLTHMLNVSMGSTPKPATYYLALFSGSTSPAANWTAANFAAVASEITSMSEGYTLPTRPAWTPVNTTGNTIDNMVNVARLTMATSSQVNVAGSAILTSNQRGATTGVLVSATKFSAPRVFNDGDNYEVGYRLSLAV